MRKFILPILLLHLAVAVNAATYYFSSSSGDDSRSTSQAQSSSTPWQSISKLNSIMYLLQPGDQVLLKSGDTFEGGYTGIIVTASGNSSQPITFGSYGSGNKPVITGFSMAMNWKQVRGNVWEAPFWQPLGMERMVIKNNQQQGIGRYPNRNAANGGYLNIDANNGSSQITSNSLPSSPNWTGADIVVRKNHWTLDRTAISSHSGTTLNFAPVSGNPLFGNNYGFFIVNSTNTLDQDGEWFYDKVRSRLQMYFSDNNPSSYNVQASTVEQLVTISFQNYVTFNNLSFIGANSYSFKLTNSNNITVNNCDINFAGIDAINALSSQYFTFQYSTISNANNNGINMYWYCNNTTIQNDVITNTAIIPGMAQTFANTHQGMFINGNYNLIQYCEVDNSGSNGIHFEGDWSTVKNCYVNTFGVTVDDCGGIYTGQGLGDNTVYNSKSILDNIVVNGIGANAGTPDPTYIPAVGIYFDNNTNHVTALRNTVANCAQTGFFNHTATYSDIENNTFYNNGNEQFLAVRETNPLSNVVFKNNICFSKTTSQLVSRLESQYGTNNLPQIGDFNNNYYCRPLDNNFMFYNMYEIGNSGQYNTYNQTLSSWQSNLGLDAGSQTSPATIPAFVATSLSGSNIFPNGSFSSNIYNVAKWSPTGDMNTSWISNKLDGGTLQISANNYSSNAFYATLPTDNSVTAGQGYQLSFTMQGAASGSPVTVYLRQQDAPNNTITQKVIVPVPANRQDFQFGFIPTISGRVSIELDIAQPNGAVWIDNVMLQQANIWPTNPDDYIMFQYNPSNNTKQIFVDGTFLDAKGATYSGNVTLQPYTSLVLFKQYSQGSSNAVAQQSISLAGNLIDATASSTINSTATKLNWKVDNQDSTASYYEVQRSSDAQSFTTIGKATVTASNSTGVTYQYQDASPLAGKNYYRITQHNNKDSVASTSKTVVVNNISFKVNPNPAKDVIHLSFDETINAADHLDKDVAIRSTAGVTVQTVALPSTNNLNRVDINVAGLQRGVYILSVSSEGKSFSKKFIKE